MPEVRGPVGALRCELEDTSPEGDYPATIALIILNIAVYLVLAWRLGGIVSLPDVPESVVPSLACASRLDCPLAVLGGVFSHSDLEHLLVNMMFLYIAGDNVEIALGSARFLALYLASGLASVIVAAGITLGLGLPSVWGAYLLGSSGAVSGLIGAYLVLYTGGRKCFCLGEIAYYCFTLRVTLLAALWVILQVVLTFSLGLGVAGAGHLSGLFIGGGLATLLAGRERIDMVRLRLATGLARGPRLRLEEMRSPVPVRGLAIALLAGLAGLAIAGMAASWSLYEAQDWNYAVYKAYEPRERVLVASWVQAGPEPQDEPHPPDRLPLNRLRIVKAEEGVLGHAYAVTMIMVAAAIVLALLMLRGLAEPERYDTTYLPPPLYERVREALGSYS